MSVVDDLQSKMLSAGQVLAKGFIQTIQATARAGGAVANAGIGRQVTVGYAAGAVGGGAVGGGLGAGVGALAGAAGTAGGALVGGLVGGPAGAAAGASVGSGAAAALSAVAVAGKACVDTLKGLAGAASPNGLKALDNAIQYLSGTVGMKILPAFVLLGTAIETATDELLKDLQPGLATAAKWYADNIPVFYAFGKAVVTITDGIIAAVGKVASWISGKDSQPYVKNQRNDPHLGVNEKGDGGPAPEPKPGEPPAVKPGPIGDTWLDKFAKNLESNTKDMGSQIGGGHKGGFGSVEDAYKKAQEAAMGGNFEKKMADLQTKSVDLLNQIRGHLNKIAHSPPPIVR
jgi:hypothetical protein